MQSGWRVAYNILVIVLSIAVALVALALERLPRGDRRLRFLGALAWLGGGILALRGLAGLYVDGFSDPIWSPAFLLGGVLFCTAAWFSGRASSG
jgi:hypothetical protein